MSITLFGWPPMFGVQGPSPFPLKSEVHLQLLGVGYQCALANLDDAPKHKAPYLNDDNEMIEDSTFIRWRLEAKTGRSLDAQLSEQQAAYAWGLERMLEDRLHHIIVIERWLEGDNFDQGPAQFFFQGA